MTILQQVTAAVLEKAEPAAPIATYGGATTAFFAGINASWVTAVGGLLIGIAGLLVSIYFKRKQDRREEAEHELRMILRKDHV